MLGKWYLTGQNSGLILGFDYGVSVGTIVPQATGTLSHAAITGSYFASQVPGGSIQSPYSSGIATSDAGYMLSTTMDVNFGGFTSGQSALTNLTFDALVNGRVTTDTTNNVIYIISPSSFAMLNIATPTNSTPVIQLFEQ